MRLHLNLSGCISAAMVVFTFAMLATFLGSRVGACNPDPTPESAP